MKYLALLSGGKDSCFNLLHCAKNGHELIAAASLGPEAGKEELDSYLYQTVGQDAIEFVARALDVPLYRRVITGDAVEQGSEYGSRNAKDATARGVEGDETEDLFALLSDVKSHHPEIQGVSVGAILSNYQRVRVEHVCRRLELTSLCYLWNRDQGELLAEMIDAGMQAIIIKVAGIGLTTKHLGKTLAEMHPTLLKLNQQYGAHICGEGGEYESLTLDCPLFKHRIVLTDVETVIHSDNDFATVAFLRIKKAVLEPKPPVEAFDLKIPPLLDDPFIAIRDAVSASQENLDSRTERRPVPVMIKEPIVDDVQSQKYGPWVSVANVQHRDLHHVVEISIEDEVTECFNILQASLSEYDLDVSNCTNINIFLSSIDLFARINAIYSTFFGSSPPARACVALDLPHPIRVRLDCIAFIESNRGDRQALHVQGLSYWAPANIGPYSQAITAKEHVFISGQIGLIPSQLSLPSPWSLATETALACQHVARVVNVLSSSGGGWKGHAQAALYWVSDISDLVHVKRVRDTFPEDPRTPTLYLVVKALPKEALVEKQVLYHTGRCPVVDEDDGEVTMQSGEPTSEQKYMNFADGSALHWQAWHLEDESHCAIISVKGEDIALTTNAFNDANMLPKLKRSISVRLFYVPSRAASAISLCKSLFANEKYPPTTPIPCRFIATGDADDWDYALCIIGSS
ncbi:Diphthine--ammonia ligase [Hypsizygus marmoreus]|uniref:Diphthine--ammonia ligase n=1 Tax=Hypsizygus marmoreus TaxID=39966 RepID=A0A369JKR6_HYPMA|nr:Diphthine--ammonia ligase [Hypsizygus marmoreus]